MTPTTSFINGLRFLLQRLRDRAGKDEIRRFLDQLWKEFPNPENPYIEHQDYMLLFEIDHYLSGTQELDQLLLSFEEREQKWSA